MSPKLNIFVLSLPTAAERRQSITNQCRKYGLKFTFIDAADGTSPDFKHKFPERRGAGTKPRLLTAPEIACALGHQQIYQRIVRAKLPYSLILEDDCEFIADPEELLRLLPGLSRKTAFDVLILGYVKMLAADLAYHYRRLPLKTIARIGPYRFGYPWEQFSCGTVGYVITQEGAKKLLTDPIVTTADDWLFFTREKKATVIHCRPLLILERCAGFKSSIRTEKPNHLKIKSTSYIVRSLKGIIKNMLMNYRGQK